MYSYNEVLYFVFYFFFSFSIFFIFFLLSYLNNFSDFSIFGVYNYQDFKQYVGAGINTLMSISDGLGPSSFCRKMEKSASYGGRDGWKSCLFPARVSIPDLDVIMYGVLLYFSLIVPWLGV